MYSLTKKETEQFKSAVRKSKSNCKLMAKDLIKLKRPIYKDYLIHVKRFAGSSVQKQKQNSYTEQQADIKPLLMRSNSSYYYCQRNQLLSLKQFIILMEESKKRNKREEKAQKRESQKRLTESVERSLQQQNRIKLRLTSSYAKRIVQNQRMSII